VIYIHTYTHTHIYIHIYTHIYIDIYHIYHIYLSVYLYIYIYIYIYVYINVAHVAQISCVESVCELANALIVELALLGDWGGVDLEDVHACRLAGQRDLDLAVEAARPHEGRVKHVGAVRGANHLDLACGGKTEQEEQIMYLSIYLSPSMHTDMYENENDERLYSSPRTSNPSSNSMSVRWTSPSFPMVYIKNYKRLHSVYTILSLPILYGVWHIKGGSGGGHIWRKSRAMVLQ